jgi:hypothetical protein
MKIKVLGTKEDIEKIKEDDTFLLIAFRPTRIDMIKITHNAPKLELIQMPLTHQKNLAQDTLLHLRHKNIQLINGNHWKSKNIIEPEYKISSEILSLIKSAKENGQSIEELKQSIPEYSQIHLQFIESLYNRI